MVNRMIRSFTMKQLPGPNSDLLLLPLLTAKQHEVLALVADNRTSKEIAGLLGVSESAVNQRIEIIRARLGGLPRGEIARLYRQESSREQSIVETFPATWKKIQVQSAGTFGEIDVVEGPSGVTAAELQRGQSGTGSQPSHPLLPMGLAWRHREEFAELILRSVIIGFLGIAGVAGAATITKFIGLPMGGL